MGDRSVNELVKESQNRLLNPPNWKAPRGLNEKMTAPITNSSQPSSLHPDEKAISPIEMTISERGSKESEKNPFVRLHLPAIQTARPTWRTSNAIKEPGKLQSILPGRSNPGVQKPTVPRATHENGAFVAYQSKPPPQVKSSLQPPGRTGDVFTSLLARLNTVETQLRASKIQIQLKDAEIENLQKELDFQKALASRKGDEERMNALEQLCNEYKAKISEMQTFLKNHGMIWKEESPPKIMEGVFPFNFAHLLDSIKALNIHHGQGQSVAVNINGKGRLMTPPSIHLAVYSNGFILEEGSFRPFTDPLSHLFFKSLVNGQFPDELRERYPNGVPIDLFDRHQDAFVDKSYPAWQGRGTVCGNQDTEETQSLSSSSSSSDEKGIEEDDDLMFFEERSQMWNPAASVVPVHKKAHPTVTYEKSTYRIATLSSTPMHTTEQSFLSHLPKSTIKNGKIVDVRNGIADLLHGPTAQENIHVVELNPTSSTSSSLSPSLTKLRIRYDNQNEYLIQMPHTTSILELRKILLRDIPGLSQGGSDWTLKSPLGADKSYEETMTLSECGLVPSAKLFIHHKKRAP